MKENMITLHTRKGEPKIRMREEKLLRKFFNLFTSPTNEWQVIEAIEDILRRKKIPKPEIIFCSSPYDFFKKLKIVRMERSDNIFISKYDDAICDIISSQVHQMLDIIPRQLFDLSLSIRYWHGLIVDFLWRVIYSCYSSYYKKIEFNSNEDSRYVLKFVFHPYYIRFLWQDLMVAEKPIQELVINTLILVVVKGKILICKKPKKIFTDDRFIHNEKGKAIEFEDGWGKYYLRGVNFSRNLFQKIVKNKITANEILKIRNMEKRMVALRYYGIDRLLDEIDAELLDDVAGYKLYKLDNVFSQPAYFLRYKCPSTGREYISGIDPQVGKERDALLACAWKWGLTKDDFKFMEEA